MLQRNGDTKFCGGCGEYKPVDGREKEANSHCHWCMDCIEAQKAEADGKAESGAR